MSILRQIRKNSIIKKDHPALISSALTLTYDELENIIRITGIHLHSLGIKENDKIALLGSNTSDYIIILLALWELNTCVIPLNTRLTDNELTELITASEADFLLIQKNDNRKLSVQIPVIKFPFKDSNQDFGFQTPGINPEQISLIMFTSGITGKPKGVMHSLQNLLNSADNCGTFLKQKSNDSWLASLPFFHIGGLSIITRSFRFGSALLIPDSLKNNDLIQAFESFKPAYASLVPTQLNRLFEAGWKPGKELKNLLLGGSVIAESLVKEALSKGYNLSNVYGATETCAFVAANGGNDIISNPASAGKTLSNNKISIIKDDLDISGKGESGEICIECNSMFYGYYKDEETTHKKLRDGKFFTGDIGYTDSEGYLYIEARRSDLIITGGENVNPVEVEEILNKIPGVTESCVFPLDDKEWGQIVAAAVVLNKKISLKDFAENLKGKIASYKIPKRFFPVDNIPRTALGKIKREQIREDINLLIN